MDAAPGGMPVPHTCMLPFLSPTLTVVVFCHCWNNVDASSLLYEPPYTEPYVRWCGRTVEVTPPPTRSQDPANPVGVERDLSRESVRPDSGATSHPHPNRRSRSFVEPAGN